MADNYRPGDNYLIDDRTGFKIRSSESRKEWTGEIVHRDVFEERHPQDFVRGLTDKIFVKNSRPEPPPVFIGPLSTTIASTALAGTSTIEVWSTARFAALDTVAIMLDNKERFMATVASVVDATHLTLTHPLPWSTSAGMEVFDYTAMALPNL